METISNYWDFTIQYLNKNPQVFLLGLFIAILSSVALCIFYYKSKQPAYYALIPIWNMVVFLRIVGRPSWHILFFLIPIYNLFFAAMLLVELNRSYGKTGILRNIFAIIFSPLYLIYMGFSDDEYKYPVYGRKTAA